jgi:hypothetical protein
VTKIVIIIEKNKEKVIREKREKVIEIGVEIEVEIEI